MVANQRGNHSAVAALETRDVSVQRKVFAVLVVPAMADHVSGIVEQRSGFEQDARFRRQMMHWLQLVKKQDAQLATCSA